MTKVNQELLANNTWKAKRTEAANNNLSELKENRDVWYKVRVFDL
jgi:hypothetical protein